MKRIALIAGVSITALVCAGPTEVRAWSDYGGFSWGGSRAVSPYDPVLRRSIKTRKRMDRDRKAEGTPDKAAIPVGPLHIIVSIDKQRATLFADGSPVASTAVSSGTPGHPTPMGVFTVIQKDRHHISNLYNASMPYMQRITWSGSALHEGPLPGYPASHGCVRLTSSFAQLLWKTTKMGARVIVTRPEVAPVAFEHARLFVPKPKVALEPATTSSLVKTADATLGPIAPVTEQTKPAITDGAGGVAAAPGVDTSEVKSTAAKPEAKPVEIKQAEAKSEARVISIATPAPIIVEERSKARPASALVLIDERPKTMPAAVVQEAVAGRPISVFVSLKENKLYVRQGWKALFDAPVSFEHPEQPIGTHVYTAMGLKAEGQGLRWTVISIPSSNRRIAELKGQDNGRKSRHDTRAVEVAGPMPSASAALERIVMPPELVDRISELITPGSSLIVSDNRLSDETGDYTDFIVLTR
jgi:hypothetical protein